MIDVKNIKVGIIHIFSSQLFSLILNMILILLLPKFLDVQNFGYWQLFLFYVGYVGIFHFGLIDGIYLRYGGIQINQINTRNIESQFGIMIFTQILISSTFLFFIFEFMESDSNRLFVLYLVAASIPIINSVSFFTYILQTANMIKEYSKSVIFEKVILMLLILILVFIGNSNFLFYIASFFVSKIFNLLYLIYIYKQKIRIKSIKHINNYILSKEILNNIKVGITLLFSNLSGLLIIGSSRYFIDKKWGIETFGIISFSLVFISFLLMFINQISLVLFPALRRVAEEDAKKIFVKLKETLSLVLLSSIFLYIPFYSLVNSWLPQYKNGLPFLLMLLPIVIYDGKMNLIYSTYLKVYRREKILFIINFFTSIVNIVFAYLFSFVYPNITLLILSLSMTVILKSLIADVYLDIMLNINMMKRNLYELIILISILYLFYTGMTFKIIIIAMCLFIFYFVLNKRNLIINYMR
ncbi:oligosaccharide flippase family protein [Exiguobacterium sp. 9-2]|uniref:oligosaccharide flippase family protein n=1 Tax=Exiguobacterium sp. 9-2 TaxID=3112419 RepID=UPI002E371583|nr:oligosaccharide flippase family protein [Exiguobacterium sp. 9-2]